MNTSQRLPIKTFAGGPKGRPTRITGQFSLYRAPVKAYKGATWAGTGFDSVLEAHTAGTAGNSITFALTADGEDTAFGTCSGSGVDKVAWNMDALTTSWLTTIIAWKGTGTGSAWKISLHDHGHAGLGAVVVEDTTNKVLTIMYLGGTTTEADIETAVGTTTNFVVATAGGGVAGLVSTNVTEQAPDGVTAGITISGTAVTCHYIADYTTVTMCETAIDALTGASNIIDVKTVGVHAALSAADAITAVNLANGVTQVDPAVTTGNNFSVVYTSAGLYTLTLDKIYSECTDKLVKYQSVAAVAFKEQFGTIDLAAKTVIIQLWQIAVGAANPTYVSTSRVCFDLGLVE